MRYKSSRGKKGFVPIEKQSKKSRRRHYALRRGDWGGVNPVTRVKPSAKAYDRKRERQKPTEWEQD